MKKRFKMIPLDKNLVISYEKRPTRKGPAPHRKVDPKGETVTISEFFLVNGMRAAEIEKAGGYYHVHDSVSDELSVGQFPVKPQAVKLAFEIAYFHARRLSGDRVNHYLKEKKLSVANQFSNMTN
jgi:hypothetical protein